MSDWYARSDSESEIKITFVPKSPDRFWSPDILRHSSLAAIDARGRRATLTGPGAVWMYAHAAAALRAAGASEIRVETPNKPGDCEDLHGSESLLILAGDQRESGALLSIRLRTSPPLSPAAIERLLQPRFDEMERLRARELVLAGRAAVAVYARAAAKAVDSGARRVTCWSARDGLIVAHDPDSALQGRRVARPDWLARAMPRPVWPVVIGVAGDPNLGKSVFANALDGYTQSIGFDGWKLDCDAQSPTPPWFLSLVGDQHAAEMRHEQKRPWTWEMESLVAEQLRRGRELFSALIADLPGGNHNTSPAQRVPPGRERIFAEIDALVLLENESGSSEHAWREALRPHGLEDRVAAVLTSRDPLRPPALSARKENRLWRGVADGLDRGNKPQDLATAFREGFDQLWPSLVKFARRESSF